LTLTNQDFAGREAAVIAVAQNPAPDLLRALSQEHDFGPIRRLDFNGIRSFSISQTPGFSVLSTGAEDGRR
jgi:hypothetical protein